MSEAPIEYVELNLCNYSGDDVSQLNEWGIWAFQHIAELEQRLSETTDRCIELESLRNAHIETLERALEMLRNDLTLRDQWIRSAKVLFNLMRINGNYFRPETERLIDELLKAIPSVSGDWQQPGN